MSQDYEISQHQYFIKSEDYDQSIIKTTDDGLVAQVGESEIPLLDMSFDVLVVQPGHITNTPEFKGRQGKIMIKLSPDSVDECEFVDELTLLPVTIVNYGYRYFSPFQKNGKSDTADLICYSMNGTTPSEKVDAPINSVCAEFVLRNGDYVRKTICPYATWGTGEDRKPKCSATVTLGFFDIDRKIPVKMQLHGSGYGAWNQLQRSYKQTKNVARLKRKSINNYMIKMSVDDKGQYCVPVFKLIEAPENLNPAQYLPVCKYYMQSVFTYKAPVEEEIVPRPTEIENVMVSEQDTQKAIDSQGFTL